MRLSDAIILGSTLRPQGTKDFWSRRKDGQIVSCALGAAAEATGRFSYGDGYVGFCDDTVYLRGNFPILSCIPKAPQVLFEGEDLFCYIWKLNDIYGWSREEIAAWVATIEKQIEADAPQPVEQEQPVEALA